MLASFCTPTESNVYALIGQALFSDGAAQGEEDDGENDKMGTYKFWECTKQKMEYIKY